MLLLNYSVCNSKKWKFLKKKEAKWLLSSLGLKTTKIPLLGRPLF